MNAIRFLLLPIFIFAFGCDESKNQADCPEDLMCTEEFRMITVKILQDNEPVSLDYFKTINMDSGVIHDFQNLPLLDDGVYPVLTDLKFGEVEKNGTNYRFEGSIQDAVVVDQVFKIGHDCCHIIVLEGPDIIEIE